MAAGPFTLYNNGLHDLFAEDFATDDHYAMLCTNSYTPSITHGTRNDLTNVASGGGYAPVDLSGEAISISDGVVKLDANLVSFGSEVSITARYFIVLRGTASGSASSDRLVGYIDLVGESENISSVNGTFSVDFHANGLVQAARAA